MTPWSEHVLWWHVYPLGFAGVPVREEHAPPSPGGGLRGLVPWVDHVVELGLNGLLLGPVFTSSTHGYDTLDHLEIDARLGSRSDFDALVGAARERGVRVLLDGVFNHVGREHPLARRALAEGRDGELAGWFRIDWDADGGPAFADFEGHSSLVALNHDNPAVADWVADVMIHWLDAGADGWRLDAAYAVAPGFWAAVLPRVRERHPGAWILGEMIHGDYAGYVAESGIDSVTQYELWKAIWSSLEQENFYELEWTLRRHEDLLATFVPQTFVGNHDVTRIASRVGVDKAVLALVVLMTTAGVPSVYAGDEVGMLGVKEDRLGGDDAVRPAFPTDPSALADVHGPVADAHRALVAVRRRHPWLLWARTTVRELSNTRCVLAVEPRDGDVGALVVELDVTGAPRARVTADDGGVLFAWG
ncbi:alpha-amylase [Serinibacter arcticus]|uniref:Alpha-amylase n=1 Tax=Serinibacter arcticus TaxID=1655435 RepID=A0A2U1ZUB6_9MICO|nr:alpha-amylase family protein [Serinibacter arcticus]PWD50574.1 alpha-amylase [Serinibacter arcticus]